MNETDEKIARANAMLQWAGSEGGLFELFAALEMKYFNEWAESAVDDVVAREATWHRCRALRDLRLSCDAVIMEGRDAIAIEAAKQGKQNV